jgi:hypothetical protein
VVFSSPLFKHGVSIKGALLSGPSVDGGVATVDGVAEGVGVAEGEGVAEGVGVAEGEGVAEGFGVAEGDGAGLETSTPLFQTNFFPDLMQVNFFPLNVAVAPALVQVAPALGDAAKIGVLIENKNATKIVKTILFRIQKG